MTWRWPVFFFKDKISRICKRGYVTVYTDSTTSADFQFSENKGVNVKVVKNNFLKFQELLD